MREPVAIVGAGVVTPIGRDLDAFWSALLTGVSGISVIERFPVADLRVGRGGEIKKLPALPAGRPLRSDCRATRLLVAAAEDLRDGAADVVVAGGYDVLCRFVMRGFDKLRSLTRDAVRPFDRRRNGLLLGEAAALILLVREGDADARGAPRLGRLLGHSSASD